MPIVIRSLGAAFAPKPKAEEAITVGAATAVTALAVEAQNSRRVVFLARDDLERFWMFIEFTFYHCFSGATLSHRIKTKYNAGNREPKADALPPI